MERCLFCNKPVSTGTSGLVCPECGSVNRLPWQMTRGEFHKSRVSQGCADPQENSRLYWREVEKALAEGKQLPPHVLREYEEIQRYCAGARRGSTYLPDEPPKLKKPTPKKVPKRCRQCNEVLPPKTTSPYCKGCRQITAGKKEAHKRRGPEVVGSEETWDGAIDEWDRDIDKEYEELEGLRESARRGSLLPDESMSLQYRPNIDVGVPSSSESVSEAPPPRRPMSSPTSTDGTPRPPTRMPERTAIVVSEAERKAVFRALDEAGRPLITWQLVEPSGISQQRMEEILPVLVDEGFVKRLEAAEAVRYSRA